MNLDLEKKTKELIRYCIDNKINITTMESCTGGGLANILTNISGSSLVIYDSFVTYSNDAKIARGVNQKTIEKYSVYSSEVAKEMAEMAIINSVAPNKILGIGITGSLSRVDPNNSKKSIPGEVYFSINFDGKYELYEKINLKKDLSRDNSKEEIISYIIPKAKQFLENIIY